VRTKKRTLLICPATAWERTQAGHSCNDVTPDERLFDNLDGGWRSRDMALRRISPGQNRGRPDNPPRRKGDIVAIPMTISFQSRT
jgi:hypothetical protein